MEGKERKGKQSRGGEKGKARTTLQQCFFSFICTLIVLPFLDKVLDQGYPQSELNINLHLSAVLFYKSIIKNSVTLFFMNLVQTKYGEMFPA